MSPLGPGVLQAWPRVDDQSPFVEWKWDSNEVVTSFLQEQAEQGGFLSVWGTGLLDLAMLQEAFDEAFCGVGVIMGVGLRAGGFRAGRVAGEQRTRAVLSVQFTAPGAVPLPLFQKQTRWRKEGASFHSTL